MQIVGISARLVRYCDVQPATRALVLVFVAGITYLVVDTNYSTTYRAFPPLLFVSQELLDTICLNVLQVFDYTHSIFLSVAFIKRLQALTWKAWTLKAILDLSGCQLVAVLFDKGAWFVP